MVVPGAGDRLSARSRTRLYDMTEQTMTTDAIGPTIDQKSTAPVVDPQARARELAILDALRSVVDPEIGMNVVELALIRQVVLGDELTEVRMVMTTPFCPYAGSLMQQVKEAAEEVEEHDVKVTLLAERWDPRDAGLMW